MFLLEFDGSSTGGYKFEGAETTQKMEHTWENDGDMSQLADDGVEGGVRCVTVDKDLSDLGCPSGEFIVGKGYQKASGIKMPSQVNLSFFHSSFRL